MYSKKVFIAVDAVIFSTATVPVLAQPYPSKPIELVVHTSAGSGGDVASRAVAEITRREKFLPQIINVNNRVGGAGVVGFGYFKTKRGDPQVMMSVTGTILAMAHRPEINNFSECLHGQRRVHPVSRQAFAGIQRVLRCRRAGQKVVAEIKKISIKTNSYSRSRLGLFSLTCNTNGGRNAHKTY